MAGRAGPPHRRGRTSARARRSRERYETRIPPGLRAPGFVPDPIRAMGKGKRARSGRSGHASGAGIEGGLAGLFEAESRVTPALYNGRCHEHRVPGNLQPGSMQRDVQPIRTDTQHQRKAKSEKSQAQPRPVEHCPHQHSQATTEQPNLATRAAEWLIAKRLPIPPALQQQKGVQNRSDSAPDAAQVPRAQCQTAVLQDGSG
eukprot:6205317-Pleurochrysis_carterae.AAC.1